MRVWRFFTSVRLTISIFIVLALVSVIGTVIQQDQPIEWYYAQYGKRWGDLIRILQLNSMYHSPWFTAFLAFLVINIVACTIDRFPSKWKTLLKEKPLMTSSMESMIERLSTNQTLFLSSDIGTVKQRLLDSLKKKRYRVDIKETDNGGLCLYAWKGKISRFGSDVTHVSLLVILLGAIMGSWLGYRDFKPILVGSTVNIPGENFGIRLDNFWIDYYDTGQTRQYNSILTVVEDGKEALTKQIWVNEPLYYKGIRFYQSSYGVSWNSIKEAEISLKRLDVDKVDPPVSLNWMELKDIPNSPYSIKIVGYVSDFAYDEESKTIYSKSGEVNNPAVQVEVYEGVKLISRPWLFFNYPGLLQAIPESGYDLVLSGFRNIPYSGISINKDPGTNVVWLGTAVMGVGFILAFFVYHRRLWVYAVRGSNTCTLKIGGTAHKNNFSFEKEFNEIVDSLGSGGSSRKSSLEDKHE